MPMVNGEYIADSQEEEIGLQEYEALDAPIPGNIKIISLDELEQEELDNERE